MDTSISFLFRDPKRKQKLEIEDIDMHFAYGIYTIEAFQIIAKPINLLC